MECSLLWPIALCICLCPVAVSFSECVDGYFNIIISVAHIALRFVSLCLMVSLNA
ncbi:hypothetical protein BGX38DRAFT_1226903 [Terfezia claveryi]|nr:hypothetical protein BGX38DRAFT_1226903 [Terfezia claveryi]